MSIAPGTVTCIRFWQLDLRAEPVSVYTVKRIELGCLNCTIGSYDSIHVSIYHYLLCIIYITSLFSHEIFYMKYVNIIQPSNTSLPLTFIFYLLN